MSGLVSVFLWGMIQNRLAEVRGAFCENLFSGLILDYVNRRR